ncbi:TorF family putative porin [Temperatibacter marinus]|uniref:TorF family putative porin n=1 Tax=Temperatibacter marinus TaxID=1456591 RepID=A0AA52EG39_9PROT|nr:TorF family putative porin [Temperatibacter marinus]WND02493.1 TorF family putative porin [Temperatibacter marinus]
MSIMKKVVLSSVSVLALSTVALPSVSAEDAAWSANTALVTDYRFRGVSLSNKDFAVQGGFDVNWASGFYVGTWASSIETFGGSEMEMDIYAGYGFESNGLSYDVGILAYTYPGSDDTHYLEAYGSVGGSFNDVGWTVGAAYAYDQDNLGNQTNLYVYTDLEYSLTDVISLSGHLGVEEGAFGKFNGDAKLDWSLGFSYALSDTVGLGVTYIDTNMNNTIGKETAVISLSASF